jgi:hypothetical protein
MLGVVGVAAALTVLGLSLVITRLATTAPTLTGLSCEAARFQARSAFAGTGFTTRETELVVDHPVRRRIIMLLMITRSAGVVTIIISLILSVGVTEGGPSRLSRLLWLIAGVAALLLLSRSRLVDCVLNRLIEVALRRWTDLDTCDYLGVPRAESEIHLGDTLVFYDRSRTLRQLDQRRADAGGDLAHDRAVEEQRIEQTEQARGSAASLSDVGARALAPGLVPADQRVGAQSHLDRLLAAIGVGWDAERR